MSRDGSAVEAEWPGITRVKASIQVTGDVPLTIRVVVLFCALLFPPFAVWIRRRHDDEELIIASVGAVVVIGVGIVTAGWSETDFLNGPPLTAMIVGTIATSMTVSRLMAASPSRDVALLNAAALAAFCLGGAVGYYLGFLFSLAV